MTSYHRILGVSNPRTQSDNGRGNDVPTIAATVSQFSGDNNPHEPQYYNPCMRIARRRLLINFVGCRTATYGSTTPVTSSEVGASIANGAV